MSKFDLFDCYLKNPVAKGWDNSSYGTHKKGTSWLEHEVGYGTNSNSTAQSRILNVDNLEPVFPEFGRENVSISFTNILGNFLLNLLIYYKITKSYSPKRALTMNVARVEAHNEM